MDKKILNTLILGAVIVVILGFIVFSSVGQKTPDSGACDKFDFTQKVFFYGDTCPHCKNVEAFFQNASTTLFAKVQFQQMEVYNNADNAAIMVCAARKCGLKGDSLSVPMFWDGQNCVIGDQPIISFLQGFLQ